MNFVLDLQNLASVKESGDAAYSISTNSFFNCQSTASNFICL